MPHLEALPGKGAAVEVHKDVAERLKVVTTALLNAQVCVDAGIASRACQVLVLPVGNVLVRLGVAVPLRKSKVNEIDLCRVKGTSTKWNAVRRSESRVERFCLGSQREPRFRLAPGLKTPLLA